MSRFVSWLGCLVVLVGLEAVAQGNTGYWSGVSKSFPRTARGHVVGICRHNSYVDSGTSSSASLSSTQSRIHAAINANADLIELDVKEQGGQVYVDHDDDGGSTGALLADVLDYGPLRADDSVLYIEVKETSSHASIASKLMAILNARRDAYARAGRPVVIRSFHSWRQNLVEVQSLFSLYPSISPYVRLHVLFSGNQTSDMAAYHGLIRDAATRGWHGVEFPYTDANILSKAAYAKAWGLGVTVWTIPASFGEVYLSNLREEVDAFVVEYDVAKARAVVSEANQLLYLNVWNQPAGGSTVSYHRTGAATYSVPVNVAGAPSTMTDGVGEDRYGTSLLFTASSSQSMPFYDADTAAGQGYLLSAYVNFDDLMLSCPGGASSCTQAIVNKSEGGAFALELYRSSSGARELRFGVYVNGAYRYASRSLSGLNDTNGYLITGAYDGNGSVWLWVDNRTNGTTQAGPFTAGVVNTNVPVTLGADPQASGGSRFFLSGKVQKVQLLRWTDHP